MDAFWKRVRNKLRQQRNLFFPKQPVIFLHIPKSAGASLRTVIQANYVASKVDSFGGYASEIEEFRSKPDRYRKSRQAIVGHLPFGLHTCLAEGFQYITVMREPVQRVRSLFDYAKRTPGHYLYQQLNTDDLSLKEAVEKRLSPEFENGQVRLIAGNPNCDAIHGSAPVTESDLLAAIQNLRSRFIVGLQSEFEPFLEMMNRRFGWDISSIENKHVSEQKSNLDQATVDAICKANHLDLQLYEIAEELWQASIKR